MSHLAWWLCLAAESTALVLAVLLARKEKGPKRTRFPDAQTGAQSATGVPPLQTGRPRGAEHSTLVRLLAAAVAIDVATRALTDCLVTGAPRPLHGVHLAAYVLATAGPMLWPMLLARAAWRVFAAHKMPTAPNHSGPPAWSTNLRPRSVAVNVLLGAYLGCIAGIAVLYPIGRQATAHVLHAWELACVAVALAAIPRAWRRSWGRAEVAVGLLVAVECAVALIGPWVGDVFRDWTVATCAYVVGFGALAVVMGVWIRKDRAH